VDTRCDCEVALNSLSRVSARRRGGALCADAVARLMATDDTRRDRPLDRCSGVSGSR